MKLIYAAHTTCLCGAGLAYEADAGPRGSWDCSAILLGEAIPSGREGAQMHVAQMPFTFWSVLSEKQPSAHGATTRPSAPAPTDAP